VGFFVWNLSGKRPQNWKIFISLLETNLKSKIEVPLETLQQSRETQVTQADL
jgi:hypothetical protein